MPLLLLGGIADLIGVDKTFILVGLLIAVAALISELIAPGFRRRPLAEMSGA